MARLKSPNTEIENGWQYVQPETGERIDCRGEHLGLLVDRVVQHRKFKGLKPDDRESVQIDVERQLCLGVSAGCQPEPGDVAYKDQYRSINATTIMSASRAIIEWFKNGGELAPKAESERRAAICRGCKFNRLAGTCVCATVFSLIRQFVPPGRRENGLKVCGICGCSLEAKSIAPNSVIRASEPNPGYEYPPWCWIPEALK